MKSRIFLYFVTARFPALTDNYSFSNILQYYTDKRIKIHLYADVSHRSFKKRRLLQPAVSFLLRTAPPRPAFSFVPIFFIILHAKMNLHTHSGAKPAYIPPSRRLHRHDHNPPQPPWPAPVSRESHSPRPPAGPQPSAARYRCCCPPPQLPAP